MSSPASLPSELRACLSADQALVDAVVAEVRADRARLPIVFPGLPRRSGREPVGGGRRTLGGALVDLDAFRRCDLVAASVLAAIAVTDDEAVDLYAHGDIEERAMLLRAMHLLPVGTITTRLLGEMQRTNVVLHLEAAVCDGDLFARAVGHAGFDRAAANRLLLKIAFLDLPLARVLGAERHANAELSRMLQDLATEREAAGRAVWRDTWRLIGRAPCDGTTARLIGGLEHGDDGVRLAAAEGLLALCGSGLKGIELAAFAKERLPREPREPIRAVLRRLVEPRP